MIAAAGRWCAVLIGMAVLTANPVVLSRVQLERADAIVTGSFASTDADILDIDRQWRGDLSEKGVRVVNRHQVPKLVPGEKYIVPLSRFGRDYRITITEGQTSGPIVYPVNEQSIEQLKHFLREAP
jgi:hypothetical protein